MTRHQAKAAGHEVRLERTKRPLIACAQSEWQGGRAAYQIIPRTALHTIALLKQRSSWGKDVRWQEESGKNSHHRARRELSRTSWRCCGSFACKKNKQQRRSALASLDTSSQGTSHVGGQAGCAKKRHEQPARMRVATCRSSTCSPNHCKVEDETNA